MGTEGDVGYWYRTVDSKGLDMIPEFEERRQRLINLSKKQIGAARVGVGNAEELLQPTIPTNIPGVDSILGGGLRKGRIALVVGHESMGKTLFVQWIIKAFQEAGELCGFIDAERTYEASWFETTGVDTSKLIVAMPTSTEQAFDLATMWSQEGMGLIVLDSLAALTPMAQTETGLTEQEYIALPARKISLGFNKFVGENIKSTLVCTNQVRVNIGAMPFTNPDVYPGGKAQNFYSTYIIEVRKRGFIKEGTAKVGYNMVVYTKKNKLYMPFQEAVVPFMYEGTIDMVSGLISIALDQGFIKAKGGYYEWKDAKVHGKNKLLAYFDENVEEFAELQELVKGV